jgi:hypothetical protein
LGFDHCQRSIRWSEHGPIIALPIRPLLQLGWLSHGRGQPLLGISFVLAGDRLLAHDDPNQRHQPHPGRGIAGAALGSSLVGIFVFIIAFCFGVYRVWQRRKRNREQGEKFKLSRQLPLLMRVFWSAAAVSLLGSYIALAVINPWRLCAEPPQRTAWKSNDPVIEPRPAPTPVPTPARVTNNKALYTIHTRAEYDA